MPKPAVTEPPKFFYIAVIGSRADATATKGRVLEVQLDHYWSSSADEATAAAKSAYEARAQHDSKARRVFDVMVGEYDFVNELAKGMKTSGLFFSMDRKAAVRRVIENITPVRDESGRIVRMVKERFE